MYGILLIFQQESEVLISELLWSSCRWSLTRAIMSGLPLYLACCSGSWAFCCSSYKSRSTLMILPLASVTWVFGLELWWVNNTSSPRQFGGKIANDIFKGIFFNENVWISIWISLKFVRKGRIDNKSALVQVMAWRRTGDKSLPEPMLTQFTDASIWR